MWYNLFTTDGAGSFFGFQGYVPRPTFSGYSYAPNAGGGRGEGGVINRRAGTHPLSVLFVRNQAKKDKPVHTYIYLHIMMWSCEKCGLQIP